MKTRKVGIIGLGHVGAHVAYSLAVQGIAWDELVRWTATKKRWKSECRICATVWHICPTG